VSENNDQSQLLGLMARVYPNIDPIKFMDSLAAANDARRLAHEHWDWLVEMLGQQYVEAFVHGYKHGQERGNNEQPTERPETGSSAMESMPGVPQGCAR
jgi:hypothetical protein